MTVFDFLSGVPLYVYLIFWNVGIILLITVVATIRPSGKIPNDIGGKIFDVETKVISLVKRVGGIEKQLSETADGKQFDLMVLKPVDQMTEAELVREQYTNGSILEAGRQKVRELTQVFVSPLMQRQDLISAELSKRKGESLIPQANQTRSIISPVGESN